MKAEMDLEYYTNFRELLNTINPRMIPPLVLGIIYGGLVMTGVLRRAWWLLVIIMLWPLLLFIAGLLLPVSVSITYRMFFLGVVTVGNLGLAYYLAR